jgi:Predicted nucleotide-binding protein containing TIR-like domain
MPLPVRTGLADIDAVCGYLIARPAGVSPAELINEKALDRRTLSALRLWGLIEGAGAKLRLSERGRLAVQDKGANRAAALRQVVASIAPYGSVIAHAVERNAMIVRSADVASHWHQHFRADARLGILNQQIVCFFRVAEGADLGRLIVGRKGQHTRFEVAEDDARAFIDRADIAASQWTDGVDDGSGAEETAARDHGGSRPRAHGRGNRVFITHRMNKKIVEQVKELLAFGKFDPVVAQDRETAQPFPRDPMDEMRGCDTAVIHVGADGLRFDGGRNEEPRISGDVLIEIGAAMALFGRNFILLVEDGVTLPANLLGLCECRYGGDELNMPATMKLFKAFNDFTRPQPAQPLAFAIGADHVTPHVLQYRLGTSGSRQEFTPDQPQRGWGRDPTAPAKGERGQAGPEHAAGGPISALVT